MDTLSLPTHRCVLQIAFGVAASHDTESIAESNNRMRGQYSSDRERSLW